MTVATTAWSLIEMPVVEITIDTMTATEIAARRDMQRKIFILWRATCAASDLYVAMLDTHSLFDLSEADAQYEAYRKIEAEHDALDDEYHRLYLSDPEEN